MNVIQAGLALGGALCAASLGVCGEPAGFQSAARRRHAAACSHCCIYGHAGTGSILNASFGPSSFGPGGLGFPWRAGRARRTMRNDPGPGNLRGGDQFPPTARPSMEAARPRRAPGRRDFPKSKIKLASGSGAGKLAQQIIPLAEFTLAELAPRLTAGIRYRVLSAVHPPNTALVY